MNTEQEKEQRHKQGDRVFFSIGKPPGRVLDGWGKICGKTGPIWIVELELPIKNYPFTHIEVMDTQVTTPPVEGTKGLDGV